MQAKTIEIGGKLYLQLDDIQNGIEIVDSDHYNELVYSVKFLKKQLEDAKEINNKQWMALGGFMTYYLEKLDTVRDAAHLRGFAEALCRGNFGEMDGVVHRLLEATESFPADLRNMTESIVDVIPSDKK